MLFAQCLFIYVYSSRSSLLVDLQTDLVPPGKVAAFWLGDVDSQIAVSLITGRLHPGVCAVFVSKRLTVVQINGSAAFFPWIHSQAERFGRFLPGVLDYRLYGQDGSGSDEDGYFFDSG